MKGYIYICKMAYEGEFYYKIGRTYNLGRREMALRNANPFLAIIARKTSFRPEREEKEIHDHLKSYHFRGEWFKLADEQYIALFNDFHFEDYLESERLANLRLANIWNDKPIPKGLKGLTEFESRRIREKKIDEHFQHYHVFQKPKKLKNGERVYRWYYYYVDGNGKKIQKACRRCTKREEAYEYILHLDGPV